MRKDLTDITLVVDRSGSMSSRKSDAEGGINHFIADQKSAPGEANLTLVQFDTVYEFVHNGVKIADVGEYKLEPRGGTALLDAVGRAIDEAGARFDAMPEDQRPALVVFIIVTDGQENSSREYSRGRVKEMIEHQQSKYGWKFTYLGADASAFTEAAGIGIRSASTAQYDPNAPSKGYGKMSEVVTSGRLCAAKGEAVVMGFSEQDRTDMA